MGERSVLPGGGAREMETCIPDTAERSGELPRVHLQGTGHQRPELDLGRQRF